MVLKRCDRVITIFFVDDEEYFDENNMYHARYPKKGFFLLAIVQQEPGDTGGAICVRPQ